MKLKKTFTETIQYLKKVFGNDFLFYIQVYDLLSRLNDERESNRNNPKSGRPKVSPHSKIVKIHPIKSECTCRMLAKKLGILR